MYISMQNPRNGMLSFDIESNSVHSGFYSLSTEDKSIKIPVKKIYFREEKLPLPRGLRIGLSAIEQVKAAYPIDAGDELEYETDIISSHTVSFRYADFDGIAQKKEIERYDIGYIIYHFSKGILSAVEIGWEAA